MTVIAVLGRVVIFFLSFAAGTFVAWLLAGVSGEVLQSPQPVLVYRGSGSGSAACKTKWPRETEATERISDTDKLTILSKPRPGYTDEARANNIQGTVILRVVFLASGEIGAVEPVKELPDGLTDQAIAAAKRIKFEPKRVNGTPQSVTRQIEYTFSIY